MNGEHTCATCKFFKPLSMMNKKEREEFIKELTAAGLDPEVFGLCMRFEDDITITRKDWGKNCKYWEARK